MRPAVFWVTAFWLAWRELRARPAGLRLYAVALALGVAAMTAVDSFRAALSESANRQARALLGADLAVRARRAFSHETRARLDSLPGEFAEEVQFRTMAWFPRSEQGRFVQVRAVAGRYPFYGRIEAEPQETAERYQEGPFALVEENALLQAGATTGDVVRLGTFEFTVIGILRRAPGESPSEAFIAPRVYIPLEYVPQTGLIQPGSIVSYRRYVRLPEDISAEAVAERLKRDPGPERLEIETAEDRKTALIGSVDAVSRYFGLGGFAGLLLGCIGVAGATHLFVSRRLNVAAALRCLGAPRSFASIALMIQALALAAIGIGAGILLAALAVPLVAGWMTPFLPVEVSPRLDYRSGLLSAGAGLFFGAAFASLPLLAVRRLSPARALSAFSDDKVAPWRDPARLLVCGAVALATVAFAAWRLEDARRALFFMAGLSGAYATVWIVSRILRISARALARRLGVWSLQQGLAGLGRPDSQTGALLAAIGLGAFLVAAIAVAEHSLSQALSVYREPDQPTLVLIDVQPDQREPLAAELAQRGIPLLNATPIVAMRLARIDGRDVADLLRDPDNRIPEWALRREYRATYRAPLFPTERILRGGWVERVDYRSLQEGIPIPFSIERSIASHLGIDVGSEIEWDVQGVPLRARVASVREVDWRSMKPNFYVVFPEGVLERAPQSWAYFLREREVGAVADVQRLVAANFPNVSVIDLALVLGSVNEVLAKIARGVRGLAWLIVATALLIAAAAVRANREHHQREWAILRALGAPSRQLAAVSLVEHAALGLIGGLTGVSLGIGAGAWMAHSALKVDVVIPFDGLIVFWLGLSAVTAVVGFILALAGRGTALEYLRRALP